MLTIDIQHWRKNTEIVRSCQEPHPHEVRLPYHDETPLPFRHPCLPAGKSPWQGRDTSTLRQNVFIPVLSLPCQGEVPRRGGG